MGCDTMLQHLLGQASSTPIPFPDLDPPRPRPRRHPCNALLLSRLRRPLSPMQQQPRTAHEAGRCRLLQAQGAAAPPIARRYRRSIPENARPGPPQPPVRNASGRRCSQANGLRGWQRAPHSFPLRRARLVSHTAGHPEAVRLSPDRRPGRCLLAKPHSLLPSKPRPLAPHSRRGPLKTRTRRGAHRPAIAGS